MLSSSKVIFVYFSFLYLLLCIMSTFSNFIICLNYFSLPSVLFYPNGVTHMLVAVSQWGILFVFDVCMCMCTRKKLPS